MCYFLFQLLHTEIWRKRGENFRYFRIDGRLSDLTLSQCKLNASGDATSKLMQIFQVKCMWFFYNINEQIYNENGNYSVDGTDKLKITNFEIYFFLQMKFCIHYFGSTVFRL